MCITYLTDSYCVSACELFFSYPLKTASDDLCLALKYCSYVVYLIQIVALLWESQTLFYHSLMLVILTLQQNVIKETNTDEFLVSWLNFT